MFKVTISFQGICQAFHSELVVINDAEENSLLKEIITNIKGSAILFFTIVIADKHCLHSNKNVSKQKQCIIKKIFFLEKKSIQKTIFFLFLFAVYTEIHFFTLYRCIFYELLDGWLWSNHGRTMGLGINDGNNKVHKLGTRWTQQLHWNCWGLPGALSV